MLFYVIVYKFVQNRSCTRASKFLGTNIHGISLFLRQNFQIKYYQSKSDFFFDE